MKDTPWIQTYMGVAVPLLGVTPEHIRVHDIAHALGCINRYTGHAFRPYNVAHHSVLVARRAGKWNGKTYDDVPRARYGLLHDASEAYLGDVASPLKRIIAPLYKPLEDAFTVAILLKFGCELTPEIEADVKRADLEILAAEKQDLLGPEPEPWNLPYDAPRMTVEPLIWRSAEGLWLNTFAVLFPTCKGMQ